MSKLLAALVCQEVFFTRHYYLLVQLNDLEISCRGIKTYSTHVDFDPTRSLSTQPNHLSFTQPCN